MSTLSSKFAHAGYLILYRSFGEFRYESTRMYLGTLWWLIEPLIDMLVYYIVFGLFFDRGGPGYIPFLLSGLVPWRLYSQGLTAVSTAVVSNMHLARQFPLPKIVFPMIALTKNLYQFLFAFLLLLLLLVVFGIYPSVFWLYTPLLLTVFLLALLGLALPLAAIIPFIPDLEKSLPHFLRILFFMSGILYSVKDLPPRFAELMHWNPWVHLIAMWRDVLLYHRSPNWSFLLLASALSCIGIALGVTLLHRFGGIYAKRVPQ